MSATRTMPRASEVMTKEPVCVEATTTIRQLARLFEEEEISGAPVVDEDGRLIGVVSKTDLVRRCVEGTAEGPPGYLFEMIGEEAGEEEGLTPEPHIVVEDFMTPDPDTVGPDAPLDAVARLMAEGRVHRVIVVDESSVPVGIITSLDLIQAMVG